MSRALRSDVAGTIYHIINRSIGKIEIFRNNADYAAFEEILEQAKKKFLIKIFAYCIMPNHWHLVVQPEKDGMLQKFTQWLKLTHTQRWQSFHQTVGFGPIYQGRYKSFSVESDRYLLQLCRYVERNPYKAGLVKKAENWQWSSFWRKISGNPESKKLLSDLPIELPKNYQEWVNEEIDQIIEKQIEVSIKKGTTLGKVSWTEEVSDTLLQNGV